MRWPDVLVRVGIEVLRWVYEEIQEKRRKKYDSKSK